MPEVLDWQRVAEPRAAARYAAQLLRAGHLLALPTDTAYVLAASGRSEEAVARLRLSLGQSGLEVAVAGPAAARDWAPGLGVVGLRLARRFWPGPLALECDGEDGLASRLSPAVRRSVWPGEGRTVRLRAPGHDAVLETLRHLDGPLLLGAIPAGEAEAVRVEQVLAARTDIDVVLDDGPCRYRRPATVVRVTEGAWSVTRPGAVTEEQVRQQAACVVVFVCTGNTCRSPLAEALCKKRLADELGCTVEELPARGYLVMSAGLAAAPGGPAADQAVEVAREHGADLSRHSSRSFTPELAAQADFLVAMTRDHVEALYQSALGARPRLLSPDGDVADPVGQSRAVYEECARQLWRHLEGLLEALGIRH